MLEKHTKRLLFLFFVAIFAGACERADTREPESDGRALAAVKETASMTLTAQSVREIKRSAVGVNLASFQQGGSDPLFVDAFAQSSEWIADSSREGFAAGRILRFDNAGWPTQVGEGTVPVVVLFTELDGQYPHGTYVISWEGDGGYVKVGADGGHLRCIDGKKIEQCPLKKAFFDVTPSSAGLRISIVPKPNQIYSEANYVKNIRVILPGGVCGKGLTKLKRASFCQTARGGAGQCEVDETCYDFDEVALNRFGDDLDETKLIFHPSSVRRLQNFNVIRVAEAQRVATNEEKSWDERASVKNYSLATEKGLPYEYLIALANVTSANLWLNLPYAQSTEAAAQLAQLVQDRLAPHLRLYLEYASEFWDHRNVAEQRYMLGQAGANSVAGGEDELVRLGRFYLQRSLELFSPFRERLGRRLYRIIAIHSELAQVADDFMAQPGAVGSIDAVAIAPVITIDTVYHQAVMADWGADDVFEEIMEGALSDEDIRGALARSFNDMDQAKIFAEAYNLDLITYRAGLDLRVEGELLDHNLQELFKVVNRDERVGGAYANYLHYWKTFGGKQFVHDIHMAPWHEETRSLWENTSDELRSPKWQALEKFMQRNPCWWDHCEIVIED